MADVIVLAVDVGGPHVKVLLSAGEPEPRRFVSGPELSPAELVDGVLALTGDWSYDARNRPARSERERLPRRIPSLGSDGGGVEA